MRTPVYILLIHYLTLEGRGGLERLHASWGLREGLAGALSPVREGLLRSPVSGASGTSPGGQNPAPSGRGPESRKIPGQGPAARG